MIYHLCHLYFWKVVKMDKMKNHPTRVSTNQSPQLYIIFLKKILAKGAF